MAQRVVAAYRGVEDAYLDDTLVIERGRAEDRARFSASTMPATSTRSSNSRPRAATTSIPTLMTTEVVTLDAAADLRADRRSRRRGRPMTGEVIFGHHDAPLPDRPVQ